MINNIAVFPITDGFKNKMLNWCKRFNIFCLLDSNGYTDKNSSFDFLFALGSKKAISCTDKIDYAELKKFSVENSQWLLGHFNYPSFTKTHKDKSSFQSLFFFTPLIIIKNTGSEIQIQSSDFDPQEIYNEVNQHPVILKNSGNEIIKVAKTYSKADYIERINDIREHIKKGDCYELNFCQDFYANSGSTDPYYLYAQLSKVSPNPFSAFYELTAIIAFVPVRKGSLKRLGQRLFLNQ